MKTYRTYGSVRGGCGHKHRTLSGAARCLERDRAGCRKQGGYSDRHILVSEDRDNWRRLTSLELIEADQLHSLCD